MRDDAVLRRALPLGRGLGRYTLSGLETMRHVSDGELYKLTFYLFTYC